MKGFIFTLFILIATTSFGQQIPQYTQWSFHQFSHNPAHAGIKKCIDIHTLYRLQWVGFDGAPKSGFLTVSVPLGSKRRQFLSARQGMGFKFETDQIGQFSTNRINLAYAAHFNFNKIDRLSLGLYGGVLQMAYDPSSTVVNDNDPSVFNQANFLSPDASFGAWYNSQNYYLGLSLQNMIPSKWKDVGTDSRHRFHANLNAGYRFTLNDKIALLPAFIARIPPKGPMSVDLNLHLDYANLINFGIGYRNTDALLAFFNVRFKDQLTIGYSFDYTLSDIQIAAQNTHEISLRFTTCKLDRVGAADCPLFE